MSKEKIVLKSCPFCDGPAVFDKGIDTNNVDKGEGHYIRCDDPASLTCQMEHVQTYLYRSKKEAAKAWNTRAGR